MQSSLKRSSTAATVKTQEIQHRSRSYSCKVVEGFEVRLLWREEKRAGIHTAHEKTSDRADMHDGYRYWARPWFQSTEALGLGL